MDLVASYDSEMDEDSDIEEIGVSEVKSSKKVDIIELDSSSDSESTIESDSTKISDRSNNHLNVHSNKNVNCINIDDVPNDMSKECSTTRKTVNMVSASASKKVDYLNLEDSDSDVECTNSGNNVNSLIDSASILNDVPCGPSKPTAICRYSTESNSSEHQQESNRPGPSSITDINYSSNRKIGDIQNNDSSDYPVTDHEGKKLQELSSEETSLVNFTNECRPEEIVSCMYREDERIIEASQKNVVCRIPRQIVQTHTAHSKTVTSLNWCIPQFSYLFLSASLDGSMKIWDLFRRNSVQCIEVGTGLNAAKWSLDGCQIITGGKGNKAIVFDVQTGKKIVEYDIYNLVTSIEIHPYMEDVFLCGTRNAILGFDIRVNTSFPIRSFFSKCEEVLDIAFLDENEFICSTNIVSHDSADRTIMAWDFSSGAILSNQIYMERFTCPSLKVHPTNSTFVAQTNGNYIASFSTTKPYKIKNKRYVGHKVSGYGIECDISPDGKYLASGDAGGNVYFYNYANTSIVLTSPVKKDSPTNRLKWHPAFSSTMITSSYDGHLQIWK